MTLKRTRELWDRLHSMGRQEISCRLRAQWRLEMDRVRGHFPLAARPALRLNHGESALRYWRESAGARFYLPHSPEGREALRSLITTTFPEWKDSAVAEAETLCERRVELLGFGQVSLGKEINWHRDPVTGRVWPRRFWADYDLVHDMSLGDAKPILELNRQQHLPRLGKAYFLTGDERYAREALQQMLSWIEQNPPQLGVHWNSSLEISLRAISWLWTIFYVLPAECMDEPSAQRLNESLLAQVDHVHRYLSLYSSPNTHLLGEAAALYLAGVLFPESRATREWRDTAETILFGEAERQFTKDGVHGELSSSYHCYALDFYLQAICLATHNRLAWPEQTRRRVEQMLDFLMHLTRPDGTIPALGDDDGGRALALRETSYRSYRDALCSGAVLFGRGDFKSVAGLFCEETLWLLGGNSWRQYSSFTARAPQAVGACFPTAGYIIQRSDWGADASHLIFDCGGMGMFRGGHGHADALSIVLSKGGEELLVDAGTGVYNGAPQWRNFFRSSPAHNTVIVDGQEQSEAGDTFSWRRTARARLLRHIADTDVEYVEGAHDGYRRLAGGVVHSRSVLYCRPDCWVVADQLSGEGMHRMDLLYHFPATSEVLFRAEDGTHKELHADVRASRTALSLFITSSSESLATLNCGEEGEIQGWTSRRYGSRESAPALRYSVSAQDGDRVLSVLLPHSRFSSSPAGEHRQFWPLIRRVETAQPFATACLLTREHYEDLWLAASAEREIRVLDYAVRGDFFWIRRSSSGEQQLFAVNASVFSCNGETLLDCGTPMPSVRLRWFSADVRNEERKKPCVESVAS